MMRISKEYYEALAERYGMQLQLEFNKMGSQINEGPDTIYWHEGAFMEKIFLGIMMLRTFFCLAILFLPYDVFSREQPIVAVFDVENKGATLNNDSIDRLTNYLCSLLAERGYRIIPRVQIKERLQDEKKNTFKTCFDESCQIELGKELAAEKTLQSQIIRLGRGCKISITVFDLRQATSDIAATVSGECNEDSLAMMFEEAVDKILSKKGTLIIDSNSITIKDTWAHLCPKDPTRCLEQAHNLKRERKSDKAYVCAVFSEYHAHKIGNWKLAREGRLIQQELEKSYMPHLSDLRASLAKECENNESLACLIYGKVLAYIDNKPEDAVTVLEPLCNSGLSMACLDLSDLLTGDSSDIKDAEKALEYLTKLCDEGNPRGCLKLSKHYFSGNGIQQKPSRGLELLQMACDSGELEACHGAGVALEYYFKGSRAMNLVAFDLYRKACDGGIMASCCKLGTIYHEGSITKQDRPRAVDLYKKSCNSGEMVCCALLALYFKDGIVVAKDINKAAILFEKACYGGEALACQFLGLIYNNGGENITDHKRASVFFEKACDEGQVLSCAELGKQYLNGMGVAKDSKRAYTLFDRACNGGDVWSCGFLGTVYLEGSEVSKDPVRAANYFDIACKGGEYSCCFILGVLYQEGDGVPADDVRAKELLKRACEGGIKEACKDSK
jgi:TPR repeat protein